MEVGKTLENMEHFSPDTKAEKLDLRNPIDFTEPRKIDSFNPHDACNYWDDDFSEEADEEIDTRPYEELSEEEQWNIDNPDYPYEDAKLTDDLYGTNDIEEWKEYKDLKVNSENPDSFMSYREWQDEKSAWEKDHPDGPPYADMMHDAILSEDSDAQAELSRWREYRQEKENSDDPDYYPSYEDWKNGTKRLDTRPYAELTEEEQYNFDNTPFSETYDEAKEIAEVFEPPVNPIPEWQEYREAKLKSENPDDFMSYKDWIDEKADWKRDHPEGPDYAETFQKAFTEGDIKSQEEFSEWNKYRDDSNHCRDLSIFPTYREWQTGEYAPNSTVEIDGVECKTDDNGKIYAKMGPDFYFVLEPNCEYTLNGYKYTTDDKGRIIKVEGELQLPKEKVPRPSELPYIEDRKPTDDRGHVVAHEFGGADTEGNLVPMDSELNRNGDWRKFEKELKAAKEAGKDVSFVIEPQYEDDSRRPSSFIVSYTIDGEYHEKEFKNETQKGEN